MRQTVQKDGNNQTSTQLEEVILEDLVLALESVSRFLMSGYSQQLVV